MSNNGEYVPIEADYAYNDTSNSNRFVAFKNPFRYRSYYYDFETKLYYLNSRYYDPEIGRFINSDDVSVLDDSKEFINGLNLYCYCNNNPVMNSDESGNAWWHWLAGALFVIVSAIAVVITAGGVLPGLAAITSVLAGGTAATLGATISAGIFIGASATFIGIGIASGLSSIGIMANGGNLNLALNEFSNNGESALWATISAGLVGGFFGYLSFKEQHPKISHSWTTERKNYWKKLGSLDGSALFGNDGYKQVLHHPFGRAGAGFYNYIQLERTAHIQLHKIIGYKNFQLPFPYTNYWDIILRILGG